MPIIQNNNQVFISGIILDPKDFLNLSFQENQDIIINLKELISINSLSIIAWLNLFYPLKQQIYYKEVPPCFIEQINMIIEFLAHAKVDSVYLPYYCPVCDDVEHILIHIPETFDLLQEKLPQEYICRKCQTPREADFESESFFFFLKRNLKN